MVENEFANQIENLRERDKKPDEPALLILDGHSSRNHLDAEQLWEDHKILVYQLPPQY